MSIASATPLTPSLPKVLWPLLFGNFVIGTGVMVVPGTLNDISSSLAIPVAVAGQLITAAALVMCVGAWLFASVLGIAPALASGSIALNTSAMYAGQALGAGSGGWLIAHDGMGSLHWFGLAALLAAMAMSWWAARQPPHGAV